MTRISPQEAQELLGQGWTYLDVRSEPEFEQGHPPGALNIPFMHAGPSGMTPNPDFLAVVTKVFQKDARIVVGCQSGGRSQRAVQLLEGQGYTALVDQRCGFGGTRDATGRMEPGWAATGLPVEQGIPAGHSYRELQSKP